MIPQEIKEKIFALYWGQQFINKHGGKYQMLGLENRRITDTDGFSGSISEESILATSLSDITDEHVIEVCIYNGDMRPVNISDVDSEDIKLAKEDILSGFDGSQNGCIDLRNVVHIIDFLRSKGYALPAHGYSVEQLIEEGVFKIKQA